MKKLWLLYFFGNLLAKTTDPVLNSRAEVEMKEVSSSSYDPVYEGFSFPDGNVLALRIVEPPSCGGAIFLKHTASGKKLYEESIAAVESIQNGLCDGAEEIVIWPFENIIWQEIPIESKSGDQHSLVLSAKHIPVNPKYLQCVNDILYPPIDTYKTDMGKCSAAHSGDVNVFLMGFFVLVGAYYFRNEIAAATRSCKERVCQRLSGLPSLLTNRRRRDSSAIELDDLPSPEDQQQLLVNSSLNTHS